MDFLVSGTHINPVYLMVIGFIIGICGGFFGVGGSFLAGPALFAGGVPMNFVVGTDLAHIVGKSIVAAKKHRSEEHTSELQSLRHLVCRLLLEKKNNQVADSRTTDHYDV